MQKEFMRHLVFAEWKIYPRQVVSLIILVTLSA